MAISSAVVDAYKQDGFDFLLRAFNGTTFLEDMTGLTEMHRQTEAALEAMADEGEGEGDDDF